MVNNNVLEEFFVWEEKNLIDQNQNSLKNEKQDNSVTTIETKINLMTKDWKDITDPKLRKKMRKKAYYEANKEEILKRKKETGKIYREKNKDKIKKSKKLYSINNKEKEKIRIDNWRKKNEQQIRVKRKKWRELNQDKIKSYKENYKKINKDKINSYFSKKRKTDIQYKLGSNLRNRLKSAINGNYKSGSAVRDLGCTIPELKQYLESKFLPGMSWDNWTVDGWHIDHIKPLSSFNLTDRQQFLEACHYTNLQPLWAKDNLLKSDTVT